MINMYFLAFFFILLSTTVSSAMDPTTRTSQPTIPTTPCFQSPLSTTFTSTTKAPSTLLVIQPAISAVITLPPNEFELHDPRRKRQKCFNDQGFSVNCATWTGYYYTWGPPGNPYEGGPGEGGGGSGGGSESGEPQTTIISYAGEAGVTRGFGAAGLFLGIIAFLL